jgi:coenzyme PQQ precursor peptide PqqA
MRNVPGSIGRVLGGISTIECSHHTGGNQMKIWSKPEVREQEVGLEVTSYLPAEIDII